MFTIKKPAKDAPPPPYAPARLGIPEADLRVAARLGALGIPWKIVAPGEFEFWVGFEGQGFHCIVLPADLSKLGPWSHVVCVTVEISDEPFPEPVLERARQFNQEMAIVGCATISDPGRGHLFSLACVFPVENSIQDCRMILYCCLLFASRFRHGLNTGSTFDL